MIRLIWAIVGIALVLFQALQLREFYNIKRKSRYQHLTFYVICTIASIFGTLGAGYSHIEKTKLKNIDKAVQLEIIDKKIIALENPKKDYTDQAINSAMQGTNLNQWAVIRLIKEKQKLNQDKNASYTEIEILKKSKAEILKSQKGVINSLSGISKLTGTSEARIAFIFLIFSAIIIEMIVFGSATFNGKLFAGIKLKKPEKKKGNSKVKRQQKTGQKFFFDLAA